MFSEAMQKLVAAAKAHQVAVMDVDRLTAAVEEARRNECLALGALLNAKRDLHQFHDDKCGVA